MDARTRRTRRSAKRGRDMTHWSYKCPINLMVTSSKPCAPENEVFSENVFLQIFLIPTSRRRKSFCKIISKSAEPTTTPYCVQNKLTCFKKIQGTTQLIRLSRRPDQEDAHLLLHNKKFFEGLKG